MKKKISVISPCYNEEENIEDFCNQVSKIMNNLDYEYEHIVIDNNSSDNSINILKRKSQEDKNLKIIINERNFGHIRSPFYGMMQATGDAIILINSDFQEPVELIPQYISEWLKGNKIVLGQRESSETNYFMNFIRVTFYKLMNKISEIKLSENTSGTGIFDRTIIEQLKKIKDPYPYFRGLIFEISSNVKLIKFTQKRRLFGKSKNNFFTLYDYLMLAIVKHSKLPLRFITIIGIILSFISALIAIVFFIYKILMWNTFQVGIAPIVIGLFAFASIQLFILGLVGEYVMQILTHQRNLPLVIEKERINFENNEKNK